MRCLSFGCASARASRSHKRKDWLRSCCRNLATAWLPDASPFDLPLTANFAHPQNVQKVPAQMRLSSAPVAAHRHTAAWRLSTSRLGILKPANPKSRPRLEILAKSLPPKQLRVKRIMGEGSFGQVFEVQHGRKADAELSHFICHMLLTF